MTPGHRLVSLLACAVAMTAPIAASAQTPPSGGTAPPPPTGGTPAPPPGPTTVVANNGQVAIVTRADALLRRTTRFRGSVAGAQAGRTVAIERFDPLLNTWDAVASATVASDGSYLARWRTDRIGILRLRAIVDPGAQATAASASPEISVTVYRQALATWYGPGFYGKRTACGAVMSHTLLGVAHRTLPCGTPVASPTRAAASPCRSSTAARSPAAPATTSPPRPRSSSASRSPTASAPCVWATRPRPPEPAIIAPR
jgi:rare lipoprotein A